MSPPLPLASLALGIWLLVTSVLGRADYFAIEDVSIVSVGWQEITVKFKAIPDPTITYVPLINGLPGEWDPPVQCPNIDKKYCKVTYSSLTYCTEYNIGVNVSNVTHSSTITLFTKVFTFNYTDTGSGFHVSRRGNNIVGNWALPRFEDGNERERCTAVYEKYVVRMWNFTTSKGTYDEGNYLDSKIMVVNQGQSTIGHFDFSFPLWPAHCRWYTYLVKIDLSYNTGSITTNCNVYERHIRARFEPAVTKLAAVYTAAKLSVVWRVEAGSECLTCVRVDVSAHEEEPDTDTTYDNDSAPTDPTWPRPVTVSKTRPTRTSTTSATQTPSTTSVATPFSTGKGFLWTCRKPNIAPLKTCDGRLVPNNTQTTTTPRWFSAPSSTAKSTTPQFFTSTLKEIFTETETPGIQSRAHDSRPRRPPPPVRGRVPRAAPRRAQGRPTGRLTGAVAPTDTSPGVVTIACTSCEPELRRPTILPAKDVLYKQDWEGFCLNEMPEVGELVNPPASSGFEYSVNSECPWGSDYNKASVDLPLYDATPGLFKIAAWGFGVSEDNSPFVADGLCTEFAPFNFPPKVVNTTVRAIRATEAELRWFVWTSSLDLESFNISVWCMNVGENGGEDSQVFVVELSSDDEWADVLVTGLQSDEEYECRAKLSVGALETNCSEVVKITTTCAEAGIKDLNYKDGELRWVDLLNGYNDSRYYVTATRKQPPPACCSSAVQTYQFEAAHTCCANLEAHLPKGTPFLLTVSVLPRANTAGVVIMRSETFEFKTEAYFPETPSKFLLSEAPTPNRSSALQVQVCPPCDASDLAQTYHFHSCAGSEYRTVEAMAVDKVTGMLSAPFSSLFPAFNWCQFGGKSATFQVLAENIDKNKVSANLTLEVPVPANQCPDMPSDEDMSSYFYLRVEPDGYKAVLTFSESIFGGDESGWMQPLSYRILVAEKSLEGISDCGSGSLYTWAEAHRFEHVPLYSPTDEGWNPFLDPSCNTSDTCSYTLGEAPCPPTKSRTFCNGGLRPSTPYSVRLRAVYDTAGLYYVETPTVYFNADPLDIDVCFVWYSVALIALAVTATYLVCRYCAKHHTCSLSCTLGRRTRRGGVGVGGVVLSRLVWFRWPPWGPAPDEDASADAYRGHGVSMCGDSLVGVPPPYSPCMFRALPQPCQMVPQLQREFEALCALSAQYAAGAPSRVGRLPQNACKNRYCNIIPFDRTRVRLSGSMDDDIANYINASFVAGYSGRTEYIASQGPKEGTTKDFWFMVYEHNVRLVIMLTKLLEDGKTKCHQYYPELGDRYMWGDLAVECSVQNDLPTYTLRTIVMNKGSEQRLVHHLHFLDWPDFGCPASWVNVLQFCRTVRRHALLFPGLMVVHCSAGVGRTGTLIAVDILLQRLKAKKKLDIFGVVMRLREQRPFMVQCQEQYIFIYKCLKAALEEPNSKAYKTPYPFPVKKNVHLHNGLQMIKQSILLRWKK